MLHMLAAFLTVAFGLSACTNAYGKEILNLELLCEGKWGVELNTLEKSGGYELTVLGK